MRLRAMGISLRVLTCTCEAIESWNYRSLSAPYWRIYWNREPGWFVRFRNTRTALGPDSLALIPPDTPFAAESESPSTQLYVHFLVSAPFESVAPAVYTARAGVRDRELIGSLVDESDRSPTTVALLSVAVHELCYRMLLQVPAKDLEVPTHTGAVENAMRIMRRNPGVPPSNAEIAREVGMNVNAFIRKFRDETGQTPQAWCMARRVQYACTLLHHSDRTIDDVAEATGFCDRHHFTRAFRRLRGVGPAAFRKERAAHPGAGGDAVQTQA